MAAVVQAHAHHRLAGVHQRKIDRHVRLRAAVRLNIGMLRAEQRACAIAREVFHHVDTLAAAVIALAGIPFGIFVCQYRAHRRHNSGTDDVFRCDQLDVPALARILAAHRSAKLRVV